jgi:hypothetical protein
LLDTTTERPEDSEDFVAVSPGDPMVRSLGDPAAGPVVLTIELRGTLRRHLVSYWDACVCKR